MKLVSANIVANCEEGGTQPVGHYGGAKSSSASSISGRVPVFTGTWKI